MNYAQKILSYLGESDRFSQVFLTAGAPPVEKDGAHFRIVISTVLTPEDILDTLTYFASQASRADTVALGQQGVFSFGIPNQGRFKIHHLTQRGSDFVSIQRMPFDAPKLETLLADPLQSALVDEVLSLPSGGVVLFSGTSPDVLTRFLYAALSRVNDTKNRVIYIVDQHLAFLMKHRNSIVIQVEVGTDVATLAEGIQNGLLLSPDLIYVNSPKTQEEFSGLMCAAQAGAIVLVSMIAINQQHLLNDLEKRLHEDLPLLRHYLRKSIGVNADQAGLITLTDATPPAGA